MGSSFQYPPVPRPSKRFERFELFERLERTCFIDPARRYSRTSPARTGIHIVPSAWHSSRHSHGKIIRDSFESSQRLMGFHLNETLQQPVQQVFQTFVDNLYDFRAPTN
jgi:hypothetical protein